MSDPADRILVERSGLFDADWYVRRYPDVAESGLEPIEHFLDIGCQIGRNPGPNFDSARYLRDHADVARIDYCPIFHYLRHGKAENRVIAPVITKGQDRRKDPRRLIGSSPPGTGRRVLLVAHVVGDALFGSERSLIDMATGLNALGHQVIVTVPSDRNKAYLAQLRTLVEAVVVLPYGWWSEDKPINEAQVAAFAEIIARDRIDVVHANTIMLREPLEAARRMGVPSLVHARELILQDTALAERIGLSPEEIVTKIWDVSDGVIANSKATAACFDDPDDARRRCAIVYNTADLDAMRDLPPPRVDGTLRVGLISSNVPKKGLKDFAEVARHVCALRSDIEFRIIGPRTPAIEEIEGRIADGTLPDRLVIGGYRDTPAAAIAEVDVVLSISLFCESFGRTVLEAMAASRPAIVYDFGAPPEMIEDGRTGFVVPFRDVAALADRIGQLADDRGAMLQMGLRARDRAWSIFGRRSYAAAMGQAYDMLLSDRPAPARQVLPAHALPTRTPRDQARIAYFMWHFPVPSETFVLNELRILRQAGHDVRVYCRQSPYPDFDPGFDIQWERVANADDLAAKLVRDDRTVVHSHFTYPTVTDMVWPACEAVGIPFTFIAHAQDIFRYGNDVANRIEEIAASPNCLRVFVPAEYHRLYLTRRGVSERKLCINPNGIDPTLYETGRDPRRPERRHRRIVAIHRFTEKKGLVHLIGAAAHLRDLGVTIELHGYGDLEETYRAEVARLGVEDIVSIHGPVKGREGLLEVFRDADLFACPSVRASDGDMDGIPTVLMEAMSAGLPVISTDLSGLPDLVRDGVTGLVTEAEPEAIAERIRAFYAMPDGQVDRLIDEALTMIGSKFDATILVDGLMRIWCGETVDLMIVSWNNLPQTSEVIRRLYANTSMPFHLVICDNGSDAPALAHLIGLQAREDNVTLILNRENAFVGPGTNLCLEQGRSDVAIYVCGKEGMTIRHGWERSFLTLLARNPRIGQAGTLCYSPSYLTGRGYVDALEPFPRFRGQDFARNNPDRIFRHVQGGFFALRRAMIDEIGGFSDAVVHNHTDVEFSYHVEASGWELGEVPGLMALFNKTRPGLMARIDDGHLAVHPPMLDDLPTLDEIAARSTVHCNLCETPSDLFYPGPSGAAEICPECGSDPRARLLHRALSESILLYRRLPALGVGLPDALLPFWKKQFQGTVLTTGAMTDLLARSGRTDFADGRLHLVCLSDALADPAVAPALLREAARLVGPGGVVMIAGDPDPMRSATALTGAGLMPTSDRRYSSTTLRFDWVSVTAFTRPLDAGSRTTETVSETCLTLGVPPTC
ncbi:glycosyltransferase [Jannaschia sp.]|nr:glycosyltransferase [Jannaschia sp.]